MSRARAEAYVKCVTGADRARIEHFDIGNHFAVMIKRNGRREAVRAPSGMPLDEAAEWAACYFMKAV
jgi:hypothetical protein